LPRPFAVIKGAAVAVYMRAKYLVEGQVPQDAPPSSHPLAPAHPQVFTNASTSETGAWLALGHGRVTLPPAQQQQVITAFAHYVTATYADQFDTYSGEQLQVAGERPYGADLMVQTKIVKSNGEATRLDYLMRQGRISDVYLDGTISQLAVHRSEFHSILQREGIEGLVAALNRKTDC
jgi:phospholipid transport system substrate-binding protein